jgi:RNA polymerase sigma-70 factor (ECF subfamily)
VSANGEAGSAAAFVTTHWSVVLTAQERSPAADAALEKLCRTYWWPLYGFVRRQGYSPEEAQDLTQGFFALLLERRDFDAVRREKGWLRSYLLVSLKIFLEKHTVGRWR